LPGRVCMPQTTCPVKDFGPGGRPAGREFGLL